MPDLFALQLFHSAAQRAANLMPQTWSFTKQSPGLKRQLYSPRFANRFAKLQKVHAATIFSASQIGMKMTAISKPVVCTNYFLAICTFVQNKVWKPNAVARFRHLDMEQTGMTDGIGARTSF